jgi:hypothetical protein
MIWQGKPRYVMNASNADPTKDQSQEQQQPKTIRGNKKLDLRKYRGWDSIDVDNDDGDTATVGSNNDDDTSSDAAVAKPKKKKIAVHQHTIITSRVDNKAIYDGRCTVQDIDKKRAKKKARRLAQGNPFHPLCRTCLICKRQFHGHFTMIAHLTDRPKCNGAMDPTMRAALVKYNIHRKESNNRRHLRRLGVTFSDDEDDSDSDDDSNDKDNKDDKKGDDPDHVRDTNDNPKKDPKSE